MIVLELTSVHRALEEFQLPFAILHSMFVATLILVTTGPGLDALTMLLVLRPRANITGSVRVLVGSKTVRLAVLPLAIVSVPVSMDQLSLPISLIVGPLSFVLRSV